MTLFEDREVEALYLQHAKSSWRAKSVPAMITAPALAAGVTALWAFSSFDWIANLALSVPLSLLAVAVFAATCAQICSKRALYQLRAATFGLALMTATVAFFYMTVVFSSSTTFAPLAVLWVCQKAVVISDVVAARVLAVVVPLNTLVLLVGVVTVLNAITNVLFADADPLSAIVHMAFELGTSVLACSGALLWVSLRKETASRTVFYWNRVVGVNVETLDAEANPFHRRRLLRWLSRDCGDQQMVSLSSKVQSNSTHEFWELDGASLQLDSKIAAGGGGVVWKALYEGKVVAAKQLYRGLCTGAEQLLELAAEVSVLAQLSHVNIVRFLGLCRHSDESRNAESVYLPLFIVQEYCPTNLRAALTNVFPVLSPAQRQHEVRRVALEIARGMAFLHSRKVLHRDLKPENVLLTAQNTVRLADFGVSVQFFDDPHSVESSGGTPAYMSPKLLCPTFFSTLHVEQECAADETLSDVYAFGVILCELLHSDNKAGVIERLVHIAASNLKLDRTSRDSAKNGFVESQWQRPPFHDVAETPWQPFSDLGRQCCAFDPRKRPSFADICRRFSALRGNVQPDPLLMEFCGRSRSVSDTGGSLAEGARIAKNAFVRKPRLAGASILTSADASVEQRTQAGFHKLSCDWWTSHNLRFADHDVERRFMTFMHSKQFFRYLRWPYVALATLQLSFTAAMFGVHREHYALYPLASTLLYGAAAFFSFCPRLQRYSMVTLTTAALLAAVVQCVTVWADVLYIPVHGLTPNETFCLVSVSVSEQCPSSYQETSHYWQFLTYELPLLRNLTIPVILLVLGLPFYLYVWLFALCVVSWAGTVAGGLYVCVYFADEVYLTLPGFITLASAGLALFPTCAITTIAAERMQRQMFLKLCSLRSEESHLLERATFRGYRDALLANWSFLATSAEISDRARSRHSVTTQTV